MDWSLIIAGMSIGLAMAAPLGPVNLIVIRTALCHDLKVAFLAGLGAVLADVVIAGIAAYGIQSICASHPGLCKSLCKLPAGFC